MADQLSTDDPKKPCCPGCSPIRGVHLSMHRGAQRNKHSGEPHRLCWIYPYLWIHRSHPEMSQKNLSLHGQEWHQSNGSMERVTSQAELSWDGNRIMLLVLPVSVRVKSCLNVRICVASHAYTESMNCNFSVHVPAGNTCSALLLAGPRDISIELQDLATLTNDLPDLSV